MSGDATPAQIGALLVGLTMKGERPAEIVGPRKDDARECGAVVEDRSTMCSTPAAPAAIDPGTFNISSAAALVAAAAGLRVAKHGNRSVSSQCGSADVYEALGVNIAAAPAVVERSLESVGIAFFFAPTFHPSMRHAAPVRRELAVRTAFNLLGPLTNPAGTRTPARRRPAFGADRADCARAAAAGIGSRVGRAWRRWHRRDVDDRPHESVRVPDGAVSTFYVHPSDFGHSESRAQGPAGRRRGGQRRDSSRGSRRREGPAPRRRAAQCRRIAVRRRKSGVGSRRHRAGRPGHRFRRRARDA